MAHLVIFDFPFDGPFGDEAFKAFAQLASHIANQPGLIWKTWTENPADRTAGGVYLFSNEASADDYISFHSARLQSLGVNGVTTRRYEVNAQLSAITHAAMTRTAG